MNTSLNPTSVKDAALTYNLEDSVSKTVETDERVTTDELPAAAPAVAASPSSIRLKKKKVPFWTEDPNILVKPAYITEFFPIEPMSFNQKLNAITRTVIVLTVVSYMFTQNSRVVGVAVMTIIAVFFLHYANAREAYAGCERRGAKEGFRNDEHTKINEFGRRAKLYDHHGPFLEVPRDFEGTFETPTASNPLSNVLLTDYDYNPNKKPAPPAFTAAGSDMITEKTKQMVQDLNPTQPDIVKKLYNDVNTNLELEQSMRQFYSTSNTTIPNDQASFAEFCYGNMISGKEGNMFASVRDNPRYNLY